MKNARRMVFGSLVSVLVAGAMGVAAAQESTDGIQFAAPARPTAAGVVTISVPTTIQRGNVVNISLSYDPLTIPMNATCILFLPVNSTAYQETILFNRKYSALGVRGNGCPMFIPNFIQYEGTAWVLAVVDGAGVAAASFTVTP
jgi:hypothetical protein